MGRLDATVARKRVRYGVMSCMLVRRVVSCLMSLYRLRGWNSVGVEREQKLISMSPVGR